MLREEILSGQYEDGDLFPTGKDLAERFEASQTTTIRRAVEQLTREGLISEGHGRRGRRIRLRKPLYYDAIRSESRQRVAERQDAGVDAWVADVAEQGSRGEQEIAVAIRQAPPEIASRLGLAAGERIVVRQRVRAIDGEPHNLNDSFYGSWAEGTPIAQPADVPQGVIRLMADMGMVQESYSDEVAARMPTAEESSRLRIPEGTVPVMVQYRIGYDADGKPLKLTITVWPSDRARLVWRFPA